MHGRFVYRSRFLFLAYWSKIDFDFDSVGQIDIMKVLMALFVILIVYAISFLHLRFIRVYGNTLA